MGNCNLSRLGVGFVLTNFSCARKMLSDIGIVSVTMVSLVVVCVVPVLYCIRKCSKRVMIMPHRHVADTHDQEEELEANHV